jgi:hypothetical protein
MRQRYLLVLVALVVALLALGALPSLLGSGAPYYVTAEAVGDANASDGESPRAVFDASSLTDRRYPYVVGAIENGRSDGYREGPFGVKEVFTHSPFDEFGAIETREPDAVDGDIAYVAYDGTIYRLEITREGDA